MLPTKDLSMLFLLGLLIVIGVLYFRIVQPLVMPLMLACVTAVLFFPVYRHVRRACFGRARIAAALTTVLILIVVLLPLSGGLMLAGMQLVDATKGLAKELDLPDEAERMIEEGPDEEFTPHWLNELRSRFTRTEIEQVRQVVSSSVASAMTLTYQKTTGLVADIFSFLVGFVIFLLALYYFLAENEKLLHEIERLSPLDEEEDRSLWDNFVEVCRGVLLGNVFAALLQAILSGLAFVVLGVEQALLLSFVTFFLSLVPFVGAGAVWGCVAIGLAWGEEYGKAGILVAYGLLVVSTVDNLVRAHLLHGHGRLHPLVALVSIIGAMQLVGFWGIIVGPVVAAFFYALLETLRKKMESPRPRLQLPE